MTLTSINKKIRSTIINLVEDWGADPGIADNFGKTPIECLHPLQSYWELHPSDSKISSTSEFIYKERKILGAIIRKSSNWNRRKFLASFWCALVTSADKIKETPIVQRQANKKATIVIHYRRFTRHIASFL